MVCKTWQDELKPQQPLNSKKERGHPTGVVSNSHAIWKQAVINSTCSPNVMQAVIAASGGGEKEAAAAKQQIDFHMLAKSGLGRKRKNPELPEPTFCIEDLLIVLELKQKKVIADENGEGIISVESLGTFFHAGSQDMLQKDACGKADFDLKNMTGILLEGQNPLCPETYNGDNGALFLQSAIAEFHESFREAVNDGHGRFWFGVKLPIEITGKKALDKIMASVTLFRRDDWRSFCLFDNIEMFVSYDDRSLLAKDDFTLSGWPLTGENCGRCHKERIPGTSHHHVLPEMVSEVWLKKYLHQRRFSKMTADLDIVINCMLPPLSSDAEPAWLEQFRRIRPADTAWTVQLDDDIAQVKTFRFCLDSISLNLAHAYFGDQRGFEDLEDPSAFLLLLEGLDWK